MTPSPAKGSVATRPRRRGEALPLADRVLPVAIRVLETGGPDAILITDVARQARVSLRDVYRAFGSRDGLIVAAVGAWMDRNIYRRIAESTADASGFDMLMLQMRRIFEPWERSPRMLESFVYARWTPGGGVLQAQGNTAVGPIALSNLKDFDTESAEDLRLIMTNVVYGLLSRFRAGEISASEIMPTIERVLRRVTRTVD